MNLRQKLRARAQDQLTELRAEVVRAAFKAIEARKIEGIEPSDILKLAAGGRVDTLNNKLVTVLANNIEQELFDFCEQGEQEPSQ